MVTEKKKSKKRSLKSLTNTNCIRQTKDQMNKSKCIHLLTTQKYQSVVKENYSSRKKTKQTRNQPPPTNSKQSKTIPPTPKNPKWTPPILGEAVEAGQSNFPCGGQGPSSKWQWHWAFFAVQVVRISTSWHRSSEEHSSPPGQSWCTTFGARPRQQRQIGTTIIFLPYSYSSNLGEARHTK